MTRIERLDEENWRTLRDLRLAALADAPDAFWATWEDENRFGRDDWIRFARNVAWFVAVREGTPVGLVGCMKPAECPDRPEVIGMWVHPDQRGSGTADALLDATHDWATEQGVDSTWLWITSGNERVRRFYERHGYRSTGERAPLPDGRDGDEERMRRESRRS